MKVLLNRLSLMLFASTLIAGCAVKSPISLSPDVTKSIDTIQTILYVPQNNIDIDVAQGNPGSTGLLGALLVAAIDEARRNSAQKAQVGVSDAVRGLEFGQRMTQQLSAELARVKTLNFNLPVQLETTDSASLRQIAYDQSRASAVLFVNVSYKLIDSKLVVVANSLMYPKSPALKELKPVSNKNDCLDEDRVIFRKTFRYTKNAVDRNNVRAGLLEGISNVAWQLATDMQHVGAASNTDAVLSAPLPIVAGQAQAADSTLKALAPSPTQDSPVGDVKWQGVMACDAREDRGLNFAAYKARFNVEVKGEGVAVHRRSAGVVETLSGKVQGSTLELRGLGYRINEPSRNWQLVITGSFFPGATVFTGEGSMIANGKKIRSCQLQMTKGKDSQ